MIFEGSPRCVRTSLKNDLKVRGKSGIMSAVSKYPGIAKLVSRLVWERGAERRFSRTASPEPLANTAFPVFRFFAKSLLTTCLTIVAQNSKFHIRV